MGPTKKFQNPNRPNFFIGVRIDDPLIVAKAEEISDHILLEQPMFKTCVLSSKCLHITLATVRLNDLSEINRAAAVIRDLKSKLQSEFPEPIVLTIDKLDAFYQNVLFAKVKDNANFIQLADAVRSGLECGNVRIVDNHNFVPHMTIMKINRPTQRQFGLPRTIDRTLYHSFKDSLFGSQKVQTIFLCPIGVDRREDGFYQTILEINI
jgi:2'-5' RNA ligase